MTDSAAEPAFSEALKQTLSPLPNGNWQLTVTPDAGWLHDTARVYPVLVDPTVVVVGIAPIDANAQDVMVDQASPTTNYGGASAFTAGKNSTGKRKDDLLSFPDMDSIPSDSVVLDASLQLEALTRYSALTTELHHNAATWDQATATWNTAPGSSQEVWSTNATITNDTTWNWGLTELVREWLTGKIINFGLRVTSTDANSQTRSFFSSYTTTCPVSRAHCRPQLSINYVPATRLGLSSLWSYAPHDFGGGTNGAVNLSTGNLVVTHGSGATPARGFTVDLTFTYNSQDAAGQGSLYGEGWSFSQAPRVGELSSGNGLYITDRTGASYRIYTKQQDSGGTRTYEEVALSRHRHQRHGSPPTDPSRIYTITSDTGNGSEFYDANGRLTRREDRNGNFLTYAYDANGKLTTITDVASRTTTLE